MRIAVNRLNHLIDFGVTETVETDTLEGSKEEFVPKQTLHFAYYQLTQTQQFTLLGSNLQGTIVIAVRKHNHVDKKQLAKIHGDSTLYKIVNYSRDATSSPIGFDLITLQDNQKVGVADNG